MPWYVFAIVSALLTGFQALYEKKGVENQLPIDFSIAYNGMLALAAVVVIPWVDFGASLEFFRFLYLGTVLIATGLILGLKAVRNIPMAIVAPQSVLSMVFTIFFAVLFLGETLTMIQWTGVGVVLLGTLILGLTNGHNQHQAVHFSWPAKLDLRKIDQGSFWFNEALLIISLVCFGAAAVLEKRALSLEDPFTVIFFDPLLVMLNLLLYYVIFHGNPVNIIKVFREEKGLVSYLGISSMLSGLAYLQALSLAELAVVFPLRRLSVLIATLVGGKAEGDKKLWLHGLIALGMLFGVWLIVK